MVCFFFSFGFDITIFPPTNRFWKIGTICPSFMERKWELFSFFLLYLCVCRSFLRISVPVGNLGILYLMLKKQFQFVWIYDDILCKTCCVSDEILFGTNAFPISERDVHVSLWAHVPNLFFFFRFDFSTISTRKLKLCQHELMRLCLLFSMR